MASEQKFNVHLSLLNNELRKAKFESLGTAPTAVEALFFYNNTTHAPYFHDGTSWIPMDARKATNIPLSALATDPLARSNHTGTQLASTISNFDTQVRTSRLDQMAAPTASVSANSQKITNLATPTVSTDAASKGYVDGASTTGNAATATALQTSRTFTLSGVVTSGAMSFDGTANVTFTTAIADAALSIAKTSGLQSALNAKQDSIGYTPLNKAGDTMTGNLTLAGDPSSNLHAATKQYVDNRVIAAAASIDPKDPVKCATTANITLSGLQAIDGYTTVAGDRVLVKNQSTASGNGIYTAASGAWTRTFDGSQDKLTSAALMLVLNGTTQGGTQWYLQTNDPITVGTTNLTFTQFGAQMTYTNGNGLLLTGNVFSVKAGTGIIVNAGGVNIDPAVVARHFSADVGDGTTTTFTVTHNLGSQKITLVARNKSTNEIEVVGYDATTVNTATVSFTTAPATNAYAITVFAGN